MRLSLWLDLMFASMTPCTPTKDRKGKGEAGEDDLPYLCTTYHNRNVSIEYINELLWWQDLLLCYVTAAIQ